jgi:hypothetical protein
MKLIWSPQLSIDYVNNLEWLELNFGNNIVAEFHA